MKTFDEIIPEIKKILQSRSADLINIGKLIINRDLNGRVRLLAEEKVTTDQKNVLSSIADSIASVLGNERIPVSERIIYEPFLDNILKDVPCFSLPEFHNVIVADRLLNETDWGKIEPVNTSTHRIVFYSIKGGVGRSTALAATAWALAEEGKRVLVLDMDLESPGISRSLLSPEKAPMYGIVDWLVEDLIDNGDTVIQNIYSLSDISRNGEIFVVPSYGKNPGEYISKIGRVWMPKIIDYDNRELWQNRMNQLIKKLEIQNGPDIILIDSRAGIDEISSACITSFGAEAILLFSINSDQTWDGYRILFDHWLKTGTVKDIRECLQIIGALVPEKNTNNYIDDLCENSWDLFTDKLYDRILPDDSIVDPFSFDKDDREAPHYPRLVRWNRGFEALLNLHQLSQQINQEQIRSVFGDLIDYVKDLTKNG